MVEFGDGSKCVRLQETGERQKKYNQDTDGSQFQLEIGCQRSENQLQTEGFGPSVTHGWAAQPGCERSAAMVRRTLGQYVAVCPRLQLTSHTQQEHHPFENELWELYFYISVLILVCSFVHWSSSVLLTMFPLIFVYVYVCGYITVYLYSCTDTTATWKNYDLFYRIGLTPIWLIANQ